VGNSGKSEGKADGEAPWNIIKRAHAHHAVSIGALQGFETPRCDERKEDPGWAHRLEGGDYALWEKSCTLHKLNHCLWWW